MQLDLLGDVHGLRPDKLQQGDGDARVPGADLGLWFHQVPPAALQVGGRGAVQGHVGQLVVEHGVVFGLDVIVLAFGHQTLRDKLFCVGIRDALTGSGRMGRGLTHSTVLKQSTVYLCQIITFLKCFMILDIC